MKCKDCGAEGATFSAGGKVRFCGQECFARFDRLQEALEAGFDVLPGPTFEALPRAARRAAELRLRKVRRIEDLTGRRFGRLVVLERVVRRRPHVVDRFEQVWRVRCDCGRAVLMRPEVLHRGARQCQPCAAAELCRARNRRAA